ncbi:hypothetical protein ATY41_09200 [Leifsonia xyli subsp. xyli]|uniref:Uncharacterized protein n=2 Tax=Leifsonia xyli subsp. xyli TaxID=59736 RepID=Q6ADV2_LEIXX|nr:DUF6264 family protein [Leifsonia xyli]AAT89444.1 hypothetical protein Lxx16690 [Leifsonia xyli subsp. xyli str. CTCB07]ODA90695.1 hypothetical protein ATY41_09200 [Leifsonia xyli subsp. xyli]
MAEEQQPDERPRPKFGELAPPGWSWSPPEDVNRLDTTRRSPAASESLDAAEDRRPGVPAGPEDHRPKPPERRSPYSPPAQAHAPRGNFSATIALLIVGLFGMISSIGTLQALPSSMGLLHTTQQLGDFHPADSVSALITTGSIVMAGLWFLSAGLSVWLLLRKRLAFYLPIVAGVVALIVLFVIAGAVIATDPALLDYGRVTPSPAGTPTP